MSSDDSFSEASLYPLLSTFGFIKEDQYQKWRWWKRIKNQETIIVRIKWVTFQVFSKEIWHCRYVKSIK